MPYRADHLVVLDTTSQLYTECAKKIVEYAMNCIKQKGHFSMALAGGSTPEKLYLELSTGALSRQLDWTKCQFYFGDERMVAHDHADSNFAMAKRSLFDHIDTPDDQIHAIPTDADAEICAARYAQLLSTHPPIDLVLLGIGEDGHTASLFPDTTILTETDKTVAAVYVDKLASWRISLTYRYINHCPHAYILTAGANKCEIVKQIFTTDKPEQFPVTGVRPEDKLYWFMDEAAYQCLQQVSPMET